MFIRTWKKELLVFRHGAGRRDLGGHWPLVVEPLVFQGAKERFRHRVVVARVGPSSRELHVVPLAQAAKNELVYWIPQSLLSRIRLSTDHGSQYAPLVIGKTMHGHGIRPSMGSVASLWDKAPTESLMGTIKSECVYARTYDDRERAALKMFEYVECSHNRLRLHSALGYTSPCEYEEAYAIQLLVA